MTEPNLLTEPNQLQREHWIDLGRSWADSAAAMEHRLSEWGEATIAHVGVNPGEAVVDIGCGAGRTTLTLARTVGNAGRALGLDISATMLAECRRAASTSGLTNVSFLEGDAQTHRFERGAFDLAFSRFGVMFFSEPVSAFANIGAALRPGGRLGFTCWGPPADNLAQARTRIALARVVDLPAVDPGAPGPHSLSQEGVLAQTLGAAGFTDLDLQLVRRPAPIGGTTNSATEMVEAMLLTGPAHKLLAERPELKPTLSTALLEEFGEEWQPGGMALPAAAWVVSARWP